MNLDVINGLGLGGQGGLLAGWRLFKRLVSSGVSDIRSYLRTARMAF
jgi:hypothetical protein